MGRLLNSDVSARPQSYAAAEFPSFRPNPVAANRPVQPQFVAARAPAATVEAPQAGFAKLAFRAGLGMLFVRIAGLPELLSALLHVNTYLLYLVGPPAMLGALITGGIPRAFRHRAALMWLGFLVCMLISVPFSSWQGGSIGAFKNYILFSFPLLFVVGGLTVTWRDVRATFFTIGAAGVFFIATAGLLAKNDGEGRLTMTNVTLTIGNSNDLASHLILVLPFIVFIAMDKRVPSLIRWGLLVPVAYALKMILGTASRGALVALAVAFLFVVLRASAKQRTVALAGALVLAVLGPMLLSGNALGRLMTLFGDNTGGATVNADMREEAKESKELRAYLLRQSLLFTIQKPLWGVGVGQFSNYVGKNAQLEGRHGAWNETHNTFTEVSSECGIPAAICFTLGIVFALGSVNGLYKRARRQGNTAVTSAGFCYLLSLLPYLASIVFLANAYRFYLPLMIGLAVAMTAAARRELLVSDTSKQPVIASILPHPRYARA